jgi:hypothetical protein
MKKRKTRNTRRPTGTRNAASGGSRARSALRQASQSKALTTTAVAVGGGALGALAAGIAVGSGIQPQTAAMVTLAGGALGAYALKGNARAAAVGAACAASGQLALAWQVQRQAAKSAKADAKVQVASATPANGAQVASAPQAAALPAARKNGEPVRNAWLDDEDDLDAYDVDELRNGWDPELDGAEDMA